MYVPPSGSGTAAASAPIAAGSISGPGLDVAPIAPAAERAQRDLDAAQRAGSNGGSKSQPTVKKDKTYGRNDQCPCGSGRKYKKCCNRADGSCDGSGQNQAAAPDDAD